MFSYKKIATTNIIRFFFHSLFPYAFKGGNCIWSKAITYSKVHYYEKAVIQVFQTFQVPNSASSALRRLKSKRATIFNLYIVRASHDTAVRFHISNYLESSYSNNIFTFPMEITFISFQDPRLHNY